MKRLLILLLTAMFSTSYADTPPSEFNDAKVLAKSIYSDKKTTFYCGCDFQFTGKSGGRIELDSCGYKPRSEGNLNRAERLEWEHGCFCPKVRIGLFQNFGVFLISLERNIQTSTL